MFRKPLERIPRQARLASTCSRIARRFRFIGQVAGVSGAIAAASLANVAGAVALIGNGVTPSLTDLVNDPQRFYSFDPGVITWKMTPEFRDVFSSPHAQNQVRLAFSEWETASASAQRRSDSPLNRYEWNRFNGEQDGYDLQTVMIHEIGHAIGSQHPDAAWFNGTPQYMLNFRPNGSGGWTPSAPPGGEVMNEGNAVKNFGGTKGLLAGEYNRIVSRDEIDFLDYVYGAPLDFVEVGVNEDAMITVDVFGEVGGPFGGALGVGGTDTSVARVAGDASQGREILTASVGINAAAPIGIMSKAQTWEITNHSGKAIEAVSIRARGSSSRFPMAATSSGAHRFTLYEPSSAVGAFLFEDRGHEFLDPLGGSIPSGATVEVGLEIDVWDWTVVSSRARATDGTIFDVSLATPGIGSWFNTEPAGAIEPTVDDHGLISGLLGSSLSNLGAKGFFVQSPEGTRGRVTEIAVGRVGDPRLKPDDLNSELLAELRGAGMLHEFQYADLELGADQSLVFVLDGLADDLPADLQASGRFELLSLPELADETLVVFVQTETDDFSVGTYALLNAPLIRVPEPATALPGAMGLIALLVRRRR